MKRSGVGGNPNKRRVFVSFPKRSIVRATSALPLISPTATLESLIRRSFLQRDVFSWIVGVATHLRSADVLAIRLAFFCFQRKPTIQRKPTSYIDPMITIRKATLHDSKQIASCLFVAMEDLIYKFT